MIRVDEVVQFQLTYMVPEIKTSYLYSLNYRVTMYLRVQMENALTEHLYVMVRTTVEMDLMKN